jgi:hypothetical protein
MMRSKDIERHQKALRKLSTMDEVYDLIDLTHLLYRGTETPLSFPDYLRTILIQHSNTPSPKVMKKEEK